MMIGEAQAAMRQAFVHGGCIDFGHTGIHGLGTHHKDMVVVRLGDTNSDGEHLGRRFVGGAGDQIMFIRVRKFTKHRVKLGLGAVSGLARAF